jgi:hypothetical protein
MRGKLEFYHWTTPEIGDTNAEKVRAGTMGDLSMGDMSNRRNDVLDRISGNRRGSIIL